MVQTCTALPCGGALLPVPVPHAIAHDHRDPTSSTGRLQKEQETRDGPAPQMDLNLMGMGHVALSRCTFRPPLPATHPFSRPGWDVTEDAAVADEDGAAAGPVGAHTEQARAMGQQPGGSSQHHQHNRQVGSIPHFSLGTLGDGSGQQGGTGDGRVGAGSGQQQQPGQEKSQGQGQGQGLRSPPHAKYGASGSQLTGSQRLAVWTSKTVPSSSGVHSGIPGAALQSGIGADAGFGAGLGAVGEAGVAAALGRLITGPGNVCVRQELPRHSTCALELDACIEDVLNRHQVGPGCLAPLAIVIMMVLSTCHAPSP